MFVNEHTGLTDFMRILVILKWYIDQVQSLVILDIQSNFGLKHCYVNAIKSPETVK